MVARVAHLHEGGHGGGAALVAVHAGHDAAGFDVAAARVVRHALADQENRLVDRTRAAVAQKHHAALVPADTCPTPNPAASCIHHSHKLLEPLQRSDLKPKFE